MKTGTIAAGAAVAAALLASRKAGAQEGAGSQQTVEGSSLLGADRATLEAAACRIAAARGCPPVLLLATIDTENARWDVRASNVGPGDADRGGAWSLPQITWQTALAVDDQHPTQDPSWRELDPARYWHGLTQFPELALQLAASLIADNMRRCQGSTNSPQWLSDLAALYNSGRRFDDAPTSTRTVYVPRFLRNHAKRAGGNS